MSHVNCLWLGLQWTDYLDKPSTFGRLEVPDAQLQGVNCLANHHTVVTDCQYISK